MTHIPPKCKQCTRAIPGRKHKFGEEYECDSCYSLRTRIQRDPELAGLFLAQTGVFSVIRKVGGSK